MKINPKSEMLRRAMSDFWWAPDSVSILDEDEATITHSPTRERIFNQVIPHGPLNDSRALIDRIAILHPEVSRWVCTEVCNLSLFGQLKKHGYRAEDEHGGFVIDVDRLLRPRDEENIINVKNMSQMKAMYALRIDIFGGIFPSDESQLALELQQCSELDPKVERFLLQKDGQAAGTGSVTYFDDLNFAFIWAGGVKEKFRGQGLYTALLQARAKACKARGIQYMGLYARNQSSAPIVAAQGFEKVGTMVSYERGNS